MVLMLALQRWGASRQEKQSRSLESSKTHVFPPGSVQHRSFLKAGRSPLLYFSLVHATLSEPRSSTSGSWMLSAAAPNTTAGWTRNQHGLSDFARPREEFLRLIFTDQCLPQPKPGFSPLCLPTCRCTHELAFGHSIGAKEPELAVGQERSGPFCRGAAVVGWRLM